MLLLHWKTALATALCAWAYSQPGQAQIATPATILEIDVENIVQYHEDIFDVSKFGTNPTVTMPVVPRNFDYFLIIGDIVAVNGQPAKGTFANTTRMINLRPAPTPGQAIGDVFRNTVNNQIFEILKSDGTPLVSRQTGDDCATALLSPTIAPGLAPAGPAIF
jgi:hypothetical protein